MARERSRYVFERGDHQVELTNLKDELWRIDQNKDRTGYKSRKISPSTDPAKQAAVICEESRALVDEGYRFVNAWIGELPLPEVAALLHELNPPIGFESHFNPEAWLTRPDSIGLAPVRSVYLQTGGITKQLKIVARSSADHLEIHAPVRYGGSTAERTLDAHQLPPGLRVLVFEGAKVTHEAELARPTLEEVSIKVDDKAVLDLAFVAQSPRLRKLSLAGGKVTGAEAILEATGLEHLGLDTTCKEWPLDLRPLRALSRLSSNTRLPLENLDAPELEYLDMYVGKAAIEDDLADVGRFPRLRHLSYHGHGDRAPESLAQCRELEELDLWVSDYDALVDLPHLKRIKLRDLDEVLKATTRPEVFDKSGLEIVFQKNGHEHHWSGSRLARLMRGELELPTRNDVKRQAFMLKSKLGDPGPLGSGFGITPYLAPGEAWPTAADGRPMHLVAQLDLAKLGEGEKGIFQFFALLDDPALPYYTDLDRMRFRVVKPKGKPAKVEVPELGVKLKPRTITDLTPRNETPGEEDWGRLLLKGSAGKPKKGDKAGGWPEWIQSPEWPKDAQGEDMAFFLQIDSNPKTGLVWGDVGEAYVFRSKRDPTVFGFCWQSG